MQHVIDLRGFRRRALTAGILAALACAVADGFTWVYADATTPVNVQGSGWAVRLGAWLVIVPALALPLRFGRLWVAIGLIEGGGLANLLAWMLWTRIGSGPPGSPAGVPDYIPFPAGLIGNVADVSVIVGAVWLLVVWAWALVRFLRPAGVAQRGDQTVSVG